MRQTTKVERTPKKIVPPHAKAAAIDDAIMWLSEHLGFPARTREQFEAKERGSSTGAR